MLILDLQNGNNLQDLCNYETAIETGSCFGNLRYLEFVTGNSILGKIWQMKSKTNSAWLPALQ